MRKSFFKDKYLQSLQKLLVGFVKDIVQLVIGEVFYVYILKENLCLDSKFEDLNHIKRDSDSFRNRWETLRYFFTKKLICDT